MSDELAAQAAGIGALAEPVRRRLYLYVAGEPDAVSREQAAEGVGVPAHTAKFHLDRLVGEGLLDVEFRRLTGRTGPGSGRPSKLYRRSARQLSLSLPERRYDLAARVLATAVDRAAGGGVPLDEAVRDAAAAEGRRIAAAGTASGGSELERAADLLARNGYEPRLAADEVVLANCPFDALVREHTALVCGLNLALVQAAVDGIGCSGVGARLDPAPGRCCVKACRR
ncbi:helix-turn-helix transcriptional regulator [Actinorugispora endophytica]|uniref:Putative ArsR family transcriptional regulator n=1 Tax=Actinorugispora endophytica TaxID=1605990 RepID=A0A4R6V2F3_9ACTN|nr:helix-turn-helix domain-containing protein [Actinorugispora endophytica]TDQ50274.1 putative ArsR family transcriptional regulator [Actinorugispora endophytica]